LEVCLHARKFWDYYCENEESLWIDKIVWGLVYEVEEIICLEAWVSWKAYHFCMWAWRVGEFEEATKKNDPWFALLFCLQSSRWNSKEMGTG